MVRHQAIIYAQLQLCAESFHLKRDISEYSLPLHLHDARRRELTVFNSRRSAHVNDLAIDLMASGRADLKPIITHVFPLDDAADAYRLADGRTDGVVKAVIELGK